MPLAKQTAAIALKGGLDTKADRKLVVAGKLLTLENGVFTSPGAIRKRNGFAALRPAVSNPPETADGSTVTSGRALATYRDELLLCDDTALYSRDDGADAWTYRDTVASPYVTRAPVVRDTYTQTAQDGATHASGLQCYAWEDTRGGIRYSVVDSASGQIVVPSASVSTTGATPHVVAIGGFFAIVYYDSDDTTLHVATLPVATPTADLTDASITSVDSSANQIDSSNPNFDACALDTAAGTQMYVAFANADSTTGGPGLSVWSFAAATPRTAADKTSVLLGATVACVSLFGDGFLRGPVAVYIDDDGVSRAICWDATLSRVLASTGIGTSVLQSVTGVSVSTTSVDWRVYYTVVSGAAQTNAVACVTITGRTVSALGLGVGMPWCSLTRTGSATMRSVALAGHAFAVDGVAYVPTVYGSSSGLQPTYFVQDDTGVVVARLLPGVAGAYPTTSLPRASAVSATKVRLPLLEAGQLTTTDGVVTTNTGVSALTLDFADATRSYSRAELGDNLHVAGGCLQMYDGAGVVEHGFHLYPDPVTVTLGSSGALSAGTYEWVVCYEWTDARGQVHRSAPSVAVSATATALQKATLTIPTLRLTRKQGARSPVSLVVYRTEANGSNFYRVSSTTAPTANTTGADTVSYSDATVSDATLIGNAPLYTTGGVLENIAPPPLGSLAVHRNRLVGIDTTNPLSLWYSKQCVPGAPVEFSDSLTLNIDPRGGAVTALASLDDKLVVFKTSSVFIVTGQGPDSTGGQNDFSDAVLVTTDCGCENPRSIVTTPAGLMFQSAKGIYLLDRSLAVSYLGAEVEAYNADTVTSAVLVPTTNQVRFTLDSGRALVFDYLVGQWGIFTGVSAADSVIWQGLHAYLRASGAVLQETPGAFTDNGSFVRLRIGTSWLQFANLTGFQRVYKLLVLGEYKSAHRLRVRVAYDFSTSPSQDSFIEPTAPGAYGSDATYGAGSVYGGEFPLYLWRVFLAKQKCTALQFTIEDAQSGDPGESMSLSALGVEVGIKGGLYRRPAASSVG